MKNLSIQDIKTLRTTPARFEWAVTYLSFGENGTGLNGEKFNIAMQYAREWKGNMVQFLTGKNDFATGTPFTRETAIAKCDELFKRAYDREVWAHNSPTINTYWTREVGNLEFGQGMFEELSRLDECDQSITENWEPKTTSTQKKRNYAQLLVYLAKGISGSKVLKNARVLLDNGALTKGQFWDLRMNAQDIPAAIRKVHSEGMDVAL